MHSYSVRVLVMKKNRQTDTWYAVIFQKQSVIIFFVKIPEDKSFVIKLK